MKNLTKEQAELLRKAWRATYEAHEALEGLRPGGGFESGNPARRLIVKHKPNDVFPHEPGSVIGVPSDAEVYEWSHKGKLHSYTIKDMIRHGYVEDEGAVPYSGATCRGSIVLGTGCRKCEKCVDEMSKLYPSDLRKIESKAPGEDTEKLKMIKDDYEKFKFLETAQVVWLMDKLSYYMESQMMDEILNQKEK